MPLPSKDSAVRTIRRAVRLIKNFCTYGNPTPNDKEFGLIWTSLQEDDTSYIDIGTEITLKHNPEQERMRIWRRILDFDKRNGYLSSLRI